MDDFSVKLGITLLCSVGVFILMLRSQKKKQLAADRQFDLTLKSRGLVNHIQRDVHPNAKCYDPFLHKEVSKSELRRVAIMAQERLDLPDIQCPVVESVKKIEPIDYGKVEVQVMAHEVSKKKYGKVKKKVSKKKSKKKGKKS